MTTSKIPPPRKLTESEDIASFDDWWSQIECYYSKDEDFREFFTSPDFTWQSKTAPYRGLESEQKAANLNNLLRAIAMFTVGPYIRTNITDKATSLAGVKEEFLKFLEIESSGAIGAVSPHTLPKLAQERRKKFALETVFLSLGYYEAALLIYQMGLQIDNW